MDKYKKHIMGDASEEPMPLYIIPDRKVSLADVREGMRNHYEGTELSMTNDPGLVPTRSPTAGVL